MESFLLQRGPAGTSPAVALRCTPVLRSPPLRLVSSILCPCERPTSTTLCRLCVRLYTARDACTAHHCFRGCRALRFPTHHTSPPAVPALPHLYDRAPRAPRGGFLCAGPPSRIDSRSFPPSTATWAEGWGTVGPVPMHDSGQSWPDTCCTLAFPCGVHPPPPLLHRKGADCVVHKPRPPSHVANTAADLRFSHKRR